MAYEFKLKRQVEFCETDMAGIVHFSNFFRYMESAEYAFYRSLGFSVHGWETERRLGLPRVHTACDYKHPLRCEDLVEIHLIVRKRKEKTIHYDFVFYRLQPKPVLEVARGIMVVVCAVFSENEKKMKVMPIPLEIAAKIDPAPQELLESLGQPVDKPRDIGTATDIENLHGPS